MAHSFSPARILFEQVCHRLDILGERLAALGDQRNPLWESLLSVLILGRLSPRKGYEAQAVSSPFWLINRRAQKPSGRYTIAPAGRCRNADTFRTAIIRRIAE